MFIEVPTALIFFCFTLEDAVTNNFVLYRSCYILLGYNKSDCALLGTSNPSNETVELEKIVQPTATVILMTHRIVANLFPILCSFIFGPWSNKHGRKPILLSSYTGYFLAYGILIILSLLEWASPWFWLLTCIVLTLGGGSCALLTMSFCYISDITSEADRDTRMGIFEAILSLGAVIGTVSSSYVFSATGYVGVYGICCLVNLLAVIYIYFFISESVREVETEGFIKDLFDISTMWKSLKICFKRRQNKDRAVLILLISILAIFIFVVFSDYSIFFFFVREQFHWSLRKYTLFSSVNSILGICGIFFALYFLNKLLKINDLIIIVIIGVNYVASSVLIGLAQKDWHIFLASIIKCLGGVMGPLIRSAISKIIPPDELGNVFSLTTSLEWLAQMVSSPFYTYIYKRTLLFYPSLYNFVSALLYGSIVVLAGTVLLIQRCYPVLDTAYVIHRGDI